MFKIKEKIKEKLKESSIIIRIRLLKELYIEYLTIRKNLGSISNKRNINKWESRLLVRFHSIEKGLSLPKPKKGFGEEKLFELLKETEKYIIKYGNTKFINNNLNIIKSYFNFNYNLGYENKDLYNSFQRLYGIEIRNLYGGVKTIKKTEISDAINVDFETFFNKRYSIRDFTGGRINKELILKAARIAQKTPSACNRQTWRNYIITKKDLKESVLLWHGGCRGFSHLIDSVIIVCSDLNSFHINERHQPYVDGSLYAMSLMLSLHSQGIGTIPLTLGMLNNKMKYLLKKVGIPLNHLPVIMIGIGEIKEEFNVACSDRIPFKNYTKIIE